ncbi:MAG: M20/M25/M40 family metallo-hydrolase [Rhodospirillales bacterium]|nr:M20/M25/M40 family metallo-hydrolase [Rhodospirillales bacterium]
MTPSRPISAAPYEAERSQALALAAAGREESIAALARLVRIPSLTGEEGAAQRHLAASLKDLGAEVSLLEPDIAALFARFPNIAQYPTHWQHDLILPYTDLPTYEALRASGLENVLNYRDRPNVVGIFRGTGGGRSLILNGHIDTVTIEPAGEWTRDPFGAAIDNGLMYGRGTSDMKGGLMAALMALTFLKRAGVRLRGDVIFQSVVNEEHAGNGTLDLVRRGFTADAAIVLEPTNNGVAVSHPGGLYWQVRIPGRPRSPGARWQGGIQDGVSAIEKLPRVIDALLDLERRFNAVPNDDPMERGRAPFALVIGKVAGGHYETVTAGEVSLRGGAYFAPGVGDIGDVMRDFRQAVGRANDADDFLRQHPARLEFLHHDDSTRQSPQIPLAVHMAEALKARGADGGVRPGPFCCDMRHLVNQGGIPSIIFGPGTIAQAHKPDEHIALGEYLDCIEHLIEFIPAWCNSDAEPEAGTQPARRP